MSPWLGTALHQFSAWITDKPDWLQNVIVGVILLVPPAAITGFYQIGAWSVPKLSRWRTARGERAFATRQAIAPAEAAPVRAFEGYSAEEGTCDHGCAR